MFADKKMLLWLGKSQTAKSSAIQLLAEKKPIEAGEPVHQKHQSSRLTFFQDISSQLGSDFVHIDTKGLGDVTLEMSD